MRILLMIAVVLLSGCRPVQYDTEKESEKCGVLVKFQSDNVFSYYYDRDTKVVYAVENSSRTSFSIMLMNSDGTPKLYQK